MWRGSPTGAQAPSVLRFQDHTHTHTHSHTYTHTRYNPSEPVISSSHRPLPAQHTTNIHGLSGILTHEPSDRAPADRTATGWTLIQLQHIALGTREKDGGTQDWHCSVPVQFCLSYVKQPKALTISEHFATRITVNYGFITGGYYGAEREGRPK